MLSTLYNIDLINARVPVMGLDSPEECLDLSWWNKYKHPISYEFNQRGFRGTFWPQDLASAVWCFGDSFTLGIGSAFEHTWPQCLHRKINCVTINISINGVSNAWISRKIQELVKEVRPRAVVAMWSYTHRRELPENDFNAAEQVNDKLWKEFYDCIKDQSWPSCNTLSEFMSLPQFIKDEVLNQHHTPRKNLWFDQHGNVKLPKLMDTDRTQHYVFESTVAQDSEDTVSHVTNAVSLCKQLSVPFVHGFIPNFAPKHAKTSIIQSVPGICWGETPQLDYARDGLHFDQITAEYVADQVAQRLSGAID